MPITEQKCMGAGCSDKAVAEYIYRGSTLYYCRTHSDQFRNQTCATKPPETEEELAVAVAQVKAKTTVELPFTYDEFISKSVKFVEPVKFDNRKPTYDLIPWESLTELSKLYEFGAKKYAADNWRLGKGLSYRRCFNGIVRHLLSWIMGSDIDSETNLHPLASVAFYCFAVIYYEKTGNKTDDRRIEDGRT